MKWPKIYRFYCHGKWRYTTFGLMMWETDTYWKLFKEFWWMLLSEDTVFHYGWNWPKEEHLIFGAGRDWYDSPIWYAHLGVWSIDLSFHR